MLRSRQVPRRRMPGFSLLEMTVVLGLIALASGIVVTRIGAGREAAEQRLEARQVISALATARRHAIRTGRARTIEFSATGGLRPVPIRDARAPMTPSTNAAQITFLPDGSSTGGTITLAPPLSMRITVGHFAGGVTLEGRDE